MDTIGKRLQWALERWSEERAHEPDKKAFQRALAKRLGGEGKGQQGISYPAVLGYFSGRATPSFEWIDEASAVLGVRPEWLAYASGPPTKEEARVERSARGDRSPTGDLWAELQQRHPLLQEASLVVMTAFLSLMEEASKGAAGLGVEDFDLFEFAQFCYETAFERPVSGFATLVSQAGEWQVVDPRSLGDLAALPVLLGLRAGLTHAVGAVILAEGGWDPEEAGQVVRSVAEGVSSVKEESDAEAS